MQFTNRSELTKGLIEEYYARNERRKKDDAWLKENRSKVLKAMQEVNKTAENFDDYQISISIPDTSNFNTDKVLDYARSKGVYDKIVTHRLDEAKLIEMIENEEIDLEELKEFAWVESTGSPRLTIKRLEK